MAEGTSGTVASVNGVEVKVTPPVGLGTPGCPCPRAPYPPPPPGEPSPAPIPGRRPPTAAFLARSVHARHRTARCHAHLDGKPVDLG
jgi:hypothetical protein